MEFWPIIREFGPWSIGWGVAVYLGIFILKRYDSDIDSKIKLALALQSLAETIKGRSHD